MPPRWLHPFLPYRSLLYPILVLGLIVVPCWLAFRLYRHRKSGRPLSFQRELLLLVFVAYLAGLAAATLAPNRSTRLRAAGTGGVDLQPSIASLTCSSTTLPAGSRDRAFCARNARGNVLLFVPLGFLLPLVWPRLRFRSALQIAVAVSVSIELLQWLSSSLGSYRAVDINDVILNVFGAGLGMVPVLLLRLRPGLRPAGGVTSG